MNKWFVISISLFIVAASALAAPKSKKKNEFKDPRDKQTYRTVKIAGLEWLGDNLNYKTEGSVKRGEEKGMFLYGGSTIVLLLEKGRADIDKEIFDALRVCSTHNEDYESVINETNISVEQYIAFRKELSADVQLL